MAKHLMRLVRALAAPKVIVAGISLVGLAVIGAAWWLYFKQPNLMTPSPLGELVLGRSDAPVTIIEYSSLTCPHCARFHKITFPDLQRRYVERGTVRYIFREYPLNQLDLYAIMLMRCAGNEKAFSLVDTLFSEQERWVVDAPIPPLTAIAMQFGLTEDSITACKANKTIFDSIFWSRDHGSKFGVEVTPTFFINGRRYTGYMSIEQFQKLIENQLKN